MTQRKDAAMSSPENSDVRALASLERRLHELREEFDSSFARPWTAPPAQAGAIVCFTAQGGKFAAPLAALQSVARAGAIVPVPSQAPALLGITVLRARLMPVFSVAALLAMPPANSETCWLAVLRGPRAAALALDSLAGYADPESIRKTDTDAPLRFITAAVSLHDEVFALLDCERLYEIITRDPASSETEQDHTS
jgi:chemotaxis signal transduction protein